MLKKIKIKIKNKLNNYLDPKFEKLKQEMTEDFRILTKASIVNRETFEPYKGYCKGKKLVICGAGPSLNKYKPIPGAIHIALNRALLFDKVHFDFIIAQDVNGIKKYLKEIRQYKNCTLLFGDLAEYNNPYEMTEHIYNSCKAKRFVVRNLVFPINKNNIKFEKNINLFPLYDFGDIGLGSLQIALYMNPTDIYLVGFDISGGHFTYKNYTKSEIQEEDTRQEQVTTHWLDYKIACWRELSKFQKYHYPNTTIHSINPVKLKGFFDDIYQ